MAKRTSRILPGRKQGKLREKSPSVVVLATGGTIAGQASRKGSTVEYVAGTLDAGDLLAAIPGLSGLAELSCRQIANLGSQHMTEEIWLRLAKEANLAMADPGVAGIVVLHGTDTIEETAYFLNLVVHGDKPLVLTGAMRPADAVSADGPMNILNAVRLAASPAAREMGALVALNDRIHAARDVSKTDTLDTATFQSPEAGPLGRMVDGTPVFHRRPFRRHTRESEFSLDRVAALPRVEIIYGHVGQRPELAAAAVAAGAEGIVHAGTGMGHVHDAVHPTLAAASAKGVRVVCSTRVGGPVPLGAEYLRDGFISAGGLSPQKARILLQLALIRTREIGAIREMFAAY